MRESNPRLLFVRQAFWTVKLTGHVANFVQSWQEESNLGASVLQADPAPCRLGFRQRRVVGAGFEPTVTALSERCLAAWLPHNVARRFVKDRANRVPRAGVEPAWAA